jgi:hypothetical protein
VYFSRRPLSEHPARLVGWVRVWVVLLAVVTLAVAAYLVVISNSLAAINGSLSAVERAVGGTGQNLATLPAQLDRVNTALVGIEEASAPLQPRAAEVVVALASIEGSLASTDQSLKEAAVGLQGALGSLDGVSGALADADDPADGLGIQNAHRRVAALNDVGSFLERSGVTAPAGGAFDPEGSTLAAVHADAQNIILALTKANRHLSSLCKAPAVEIVTGAPC